MLINAYGGELVEIPSVSKNISDGVYIIQDRFIFDLELLSNGAFSPLNGFMDKKNALSVINNMRLSNGLLWSIPILLPAQGDFKEGNIISFENKDNLSVGTFLITDIFELDLENYVKKVFKTADKNHPGVSAVYSFGNKFFGGILLSYNYSLKIEGISSLFSPKETRAFIEEKGWETIVAFQTRNPIHRAHEYIIKVAQESLDGLLIHPLVGETKSDDIPADVRAKCYEELVENYFNKERTFLSYLPATMRYAGPREAILHMIIRQNYGATHMIIGRDHAGVGNYYGTYDAQELVDVYKDELDIKALKFEHSFYCKKCESIVSHKTCPHDMSYHIILSGTKVREMLQKGERPPKEFSRPEIADILIKAAQENIS